MPSRYVPAKRTIGELLTITNPPIIVPEWQRNYSWTTSEVETFWQDLLRFDRTYPDANIEEEEYFLGSIVMVDVNTAHKLLDGQQRIATSAILISVVRDFLAPNDRNAANRVSNRYLMDFDDARNRNIYKLTLNRYDRDFFRREILESRDANYVAPVPTMESHNLIRKAREFFTRAFEGGAAQFATPAESRQWALRILAVLTNHFSVVAVISEDEDNAATVFETLNDRGIGLSTPDLLRNLLLRRSEQEPEREEIIDLWRVILEIESDAKLTTFLRHYWISREGDVKTQSLYREIKHNIEENHVSSLAFSRDLRDASIVYRDLLAGRDDDEQLSVMLSDVAVLGASLLYPAMLSAYEVCDKPQMKSFVQALLTTYVRHSIIGGRENSRLEAVLYQIARDLRQGLQIDQAIVQLRNFAPADEVFKAVFASASISKIAAVRYILKQIEQHLRTTEELDVASPSRVHVEHIYPQTPREGERWGEHVAYINRLGNLTLLSRRFNVTLRNAPFSDKAPVYGESDIVLTRHLAEHQEWSPAAIEERQSGFAELAPLIWSFPV
jgi:hypothetical protein